MSEREKLRVHLGKRITVRAVYERSGANPRLPYATACLQSVDLDGERIADHVWVQRAETLTNLEPKYGDVVEFSARVMSKKDKDGRYTDYSLACPTGVTLLED